MSGGTVAVIALLIWVPAAAVGDVSDAPYEWLTTAMRDAETSLRAGKTGKQVQGLEQEIIDELDVLIATHERQEAAEVRAMAVRGKADKEQPGGDTSKPVKPAEESVLPPGVWRGRVTGEAQAAAGTWLPELPPAEREKIADTFGAGRLPAHYRELLRHYSRRLAESEE